MGRTVHRKHGSKTKASKHPVEPEAVREDEPSLGEALIESVKEIEESNKGFGLAEAVQILSAVLKDDPAYYRIWHTQLSEAFQNEWNRSKNLQEAIRSIADRAANNFLVKLCHDN